MVLPAHPETTPCSLIHVAWVKGGTWMVSSLPSPAFPVYPMQERGLRPNPSSHLWATMKGEVLLN